MYNPYTLQHKSFKVRQILMLQGDKINCLRVKSQDAD